MRKPRQQARSAAPLARPRQAVFVESVGERSPVEPELFGRAGLVAGVSLERLDDTTTLHRAELAAERAPIDRPLWRLARLADRLRTLGFDYATRAGVSICMDHMVIPQAKGVLLGEAQAEVQRVIDQYQEGLITDGERYNKIVDIWAGVADLVTQEMMSVIGKETITDPETGTELLEPF